MGWEEKYGKQTLNTSKNTSVSERHKQERQKDEENMINIVKVQRERTGREGNRMKQKK